VILRVFGLSNEFNVLGPAGVNNGVDNTSMYAIAIFAFKKCISFAPRKKKVDLMFLWRDLTLTFCAALPPLAVGRRYQDVAPPGLGRFVLSWQPTGRRLSRQRANCT